MPTARMSTPPPTALEPPVTPEQKRLLLMLAAGGDTVAIAKRLGVAQSTVWRHIRELRERTNSATVAQLVATALRKRWIR